MKKDLAIQHVDYVGELTNLLHSYHTNDKGGNAMKSQNGYTEQIYFMINPKDNTCYPTNVLKEIKELKEKGYVVESTDPRMR